VSCEADNHIMSIRITRTAQASWSGTVAEGGGRLGLGSGAFEGPFTLKARVNTTPPTPAGANPEELMGAAHAGCFTMSLADQLTEAGHPPTDLRTTARVVLEQKPEGFRITRITLTTDVEVPGVDDAQFQDFAERAKATCPVSLALAGTEIALDARLV
jgi:lipoyl-dependent peroxiredoxin